MTLRVKLIGGFFIVAVITLIVSAIGYWQSQKLATALYQVGVVRLPSVRALDTIFEAKTALDASKRELLREAILFENDSRISAQLVQVPLTGSADAPKAVPAWEAWGGVLQEELRRQQQAWERAEKGWKAYEPLLRTPEEEAQWKEFVGAWSAWRASYEKVMARLSRARATGDRALLTAAREENDTHLYEPARVSRQLLTDLLQSNEKSAAATKQQSVASHRDVQLVGYFMLAAAAASVAAAIGCGIFMSGLISRPVRQMAGAFSQIAQGDLNTRVPVGSKDEIGQMADAMNRMVESLRMSELRFRAVFENSIDAIGVSKKSHLVLANPALPALFGYDNPEAMIGRPIFDFIAIEDRAFVLDRIRLHDRGHALAPMFELTGLRKDGTKFAMEVQTAHFTLQGEQYTVAIQRDITERKQAAERLQESAERLELALRTSKLGVWRRHLTTHAAEWDTRMFEIFGLPPADRPPTREQLLAMIVPEDREQAWQAWNAAPDPSLTYHHRFRITRPDGQVRHLEVHGIVHIDASRPFEWSLGVTGDITGIVDAVAESSRLREQLLQAQKMEALGTLSAGIAHDFNNLLTGINGFIELATATVPAGHEGAELLRQAHQGTVSARELVRRILTFSRQAHTSQRTALHLGEFVQETVPLIAATLPANIFLGLEIDPSLPRVMADGGQLQQVLLNLCTNGAHAIGGNAGRLGIGVSSRELPATPGGPLPAGCRAGSHVCLTVNDTGSGMDEATVQRIFDPFFTTKRPGEGTGLGLAIVSDILATHEAGVEVASMPGRGTTFTLFFPAHAGASPAAPAALEANPPRPGAGQRIMVVDDEPAISRVVELALHRGGYTPEVFNSPLAAWTRFEENTGNYQLLIIDQQMPGMSGLDFIARARTLAPGLPVIKMSGRFERLATDGQPEPAGITQLKKPFGIAELLDAVAATLPV